ncbi:hypothetical protein GOP47_0024148 [Adiantum capillus-veneris]|uniref:Late embryogenesis abundant protein LEA-2 subgroup domain-containing protein n=1 Tax=Adiantum capillus-veneris TaxID=13818 RepID=A0A9D4Z409_ADICA|nr:hypothetical protein GOP47_0024148 [Adiantum capillus-veneris]
MADRVFPLSGDRDELHKRGFTRASPLYSLPPAFNGDGERRRACSRCSCCCYICVTMAAFFLLLFIVGASLYLLLRPKAPTFSITRAHINQFALTAHEQQQRNDGGPSQSSSAHLHLVSDVNFTLLAENSNSKIGFRYEQVSVELSYGAQVIGRGAIPAALYVGPSDRMQVELQVKGADILLQERVGLALQKVLQGRPSSSNSVWMQVNAMTRLRVHVWSFRSREVHVHIICDVHMRRPLPRTDAHLLSKSCKLKSVTL